MPQHSPSLILVRSLAEAEAKAGRHDAIEPAHLFLGLCKLCDLQLNQMLLGKLPNADQVLPAIEIEMAELRLAFSNAGLKPTEFRRRLRAALGRGSAENKDERLHRSPECRQVFERAEEIVMAGDGTVRAIHLLASLKEVENPPWAGLFAEMNVRADQLRQQSPSPLSSPPAGRGNRAVRPPNAAPEIPSPLAGEGRVRGAKDRQQSILAKYGRDLTQLAADGRLSAVIGRGKETRTLAQILMQKRKNNAILVGEAGVGKTAVVEGLAQRIVQPNPPAGLAGKRIIEVTMAALVAGAKYRGDFEQRMQGIVNEASADKDLILFIDEIHTLMGAGGEGSADAANILKPALARGDLRCIGATTIAEYRKHIEKDPALERRFQVVWVEEPSRDEAVEILRGLKPKLEEHHGIGIGDEAILAAVDLSIRYLPDFRLPDKAIDLLDQACARARLQTLSPQPQAAPSEITVGRKEIAEVVAVRCRIPVDQLSEDEAQRLLRMEESILKRVMGQDEAVREVCDAIRTARAGLKNPKKPVGVFLFVGTTGTGKTELAKAVAEFMFGDERKLIRIDMSEFMEQHAVAKLIGSPPGYVGHDEEGQLTGPVRSNPYSVVLFDEIEKAHPRVLDLFLQIFDEGRLTDSRGRHASFTEAVVIMTSNLGAARVGADERKPQLGFGAGSGPRTASEATQRDAYRQRIMSAVRQELRPELVNRIDRSVFFYPLGSDAVRAIIDKILNSLRARLHERRISLELTDDAYTLLMQEGFDPELGAREMERTVDRLLVQPLGKALLERRFAEGATVRVDARGNEMVME
ncbi:MAG: ATP-dependent Clp protease ATP-binding subunit [Verrucomicrobiae bacterium]|nr:ATP-dependent Clp protease ATP-binding subunit [Verrucomicrobiae bacterium]